MYHHISPTAPSDPSQSQLTVTTADFRRQLEHLRAQGYTSISLTELFDAAYNNAPLPPKPVILTFDDGYDDAFTYAFPLLQEYGFKGTFAVITGQVGKLWYLNWEQIKTMAAAGMEFASHTVNHADLRTILDDAIGNELKNSKRALEEQLGKPVSFFVYPFGEPFRSGSQVRQQAVLSLLRESGYLGALLAGASLTVQDFRQPYTLNRVRVSGGDSLQIFVALLR